MCDGKIDCEDGRDESPDLCMSMGISGMYQCANGVYISKSKCCDNVFDCIDGSDEIEKMCRNQVGWLWNTPKVCVEPKEKGLRFAGNTIYHKNRTHRFVYPSQPVRFACRDTSTHIKGTEWDVCLRTGKWNIGDTLCPAKKLNLNADTNGTNGCAIDTYDENLIIKQCRHYNCATEVYPPINSMTVQFSCRGNTVLYPSNLTLSKIECKDKQWSRNKVPYHAPTCLSKYAFVGRIIAELIMLIMLTQRHATVAKSIVTTWCCRYVPFQK